MQNLDNPIEEVIAQVYKIFMEMLDFKNILLKRDYIVLKYEDLFVSSEKILKKMIKFTTNDLSIFSEKKKILKQNSIESFSTNYKNKNKIIFLIKNIRRNSIFYFKRYFKNFDYKKNLKIFIKPINFLFCKDS